MLVITELGESQPWANGILNSRKNWESNNSKFGNFLNLEIAREILIDLGCDSPSSAFKVFSTSKSFSSEKRQLKTELALVNLIPGIWLIDMS